MTPFIETIDKAVSEVEKLQKIIKKSSTKQVRSNDEKSILKAISLSWFHTHRGIFITTLNEKLVEHIDSNYREILTSADKSGLRQKFLNLSKQIRVDLLKLRNDNITTVTKSFIKTEDTVPSFSIIVSDQEMQNILTSRWSECIKCVEADAPLSAVVMMGGLLETLLLTKINKLPNQAPVFTSNSAPKNSKTNQTLPLKEWTLQHYIDVAHELKWITQTEKDLGVFLRDYRNFIHPFKQRTYNMVLTQNDSRILWELCKNISKQLIK